MVPKVVTSSISLSQHNFMLLDPTLFTSNSFDFRLDEIEVHVLNDVLRQDKTRQDGLF